MPLISPYSRSGESMPRVTSDRQIGGVIWSAVVSMLAVLPTQQRLHDCERCMQFSHSKCDAFATDSGQVMPNEVCFAGRPPQGSPVSMPGIGRHDAVIASCNCMLQPQFLERLQASFRSHLFARTSRASHPSGSEVLAGS